MTDVPDKEKLIALFAATGDKLFDEFAETKDPDPVPVRVFKIPEFMCLTCGQQFNREDCSRDRNPRNKVHRCPYCRSETVAKQWENLSAEAADRKYSPDMEQQIAGIKDSKYARFNLARDVRAGRLKRKK